MVMICIKEIASLLLYYHLFCTTTLLSSLQESHLTQKWCLPFFHLTLQAHSHCCCRICFFFCLLALFQVSLNENAFTNCGKTELEVFLPIKKGGQSRSKDFNFANGHQLQTMLTKDCLVQEQQTLSPNLP